MPRVTKLSKKPGDHVAYLVDANFLANRFIPVAKVTDAKERQRTERSREWWSILDRQSVVRELQQCGRVERCAGR